MIFLLVSKLTSKTKRFPVLSQKPTERSWKKQSFIFYLFDEHLIQTSVLLNTRQ